MTNYILLVSGFLFLVVLCFVPGLIELRWPRDSGPIEIDLDRDMDERYFSKAFRRYLKDSLFAPDAKTIPFDRSEAWLKAMPAKKVRIAIHRGPEAVSVIEGSAELSAGTRHSGVLYVKGDLSIGSNSVFDKEILVEGACTVGRGSRLRCLSAQNIRLGDDVAVEGWIDTDETLTLGPGCRVGSRATAGDRVVFNGAADVRSVAAGRIEATGGNGGLSRREPAEMPVDDLGPLQVELDSMIMQEYRSKPLDEIAAAFEVAAGRNIPYRLAVDRAAHCEVVEEALVALERAQKPEYLKKLPVWLQAPRTLRIRGDVSVPDGARLGHDLIVEGNLYSGEACIFEGGVRVAGQAKVGPGNKFHASLVVGGNVEIERDSQVYCCLDSGGAIKLGRGVMIGSTGEGGVAARRGVRLESNVVAYGKIYSDSRVQVLEHTG